MSLIHVFKNVMENVNPELYTRHNPALEDSTFQQEIAKPLTPGQLI